MSKEDLDENAEENEKYEKIEKIESPTLTDEEIKESIKAEVESSIKELLLEDEKVKEIEDSVGVLKGEEIEEIKEELGLEEKIGEINNEAEDLKEEAEIAIESEGKLTPETYKKAEALFLARESLSIAEKEMADLERRESEMSFNQLKIRRTSIEVKILKAKGDVLESSGLISEDQVNLYTQMRESDVGKIRGKTEDEKKTEAVLDDFIKKFDLLDDKVKEMGFTLETVDSLQYSMDKDDVKKDEEIKKLIEELRIAEMYESLSINNPNILLDAVSLSRINSPFLKNMIFSEAVNDKSVSQGKLVEIAFSKIINYENEKNILEDLEDKLTKDKQSALLRLPIMDVISEWEKEAPSLYWEPHKEKDIFRNKLANEIDRLRALEKYDEILDIKERIDKLKEKNDNSTISFSESCPSWLTSLNINSRDSLALLTHTMSKDSFSYYMNYNLAFVPFNLIPDDFDESEREKFENRIFFQDLSNEKLEYYSKMTGYSIDDTIRNGILAQKNVSGNRIKMLEFLSRAMETYKVDKSVFDNPEIKELAEDMYRNSIVHEDEEDSNKIKEIFMMDKAVTNEISTMAMAHAMFNRTKIPRTLDGFDIKQELENNPELKKMIFENLVSCIHVFNVEDVSEFKNKLNLKDEEVSQFVIDNLTLLNENNSTAIKLDKVFEFAKYASNVEGLQNKIESIVKLRRTKEILENKELLPTLVKEQLEKFENQYGEKGKNIMTLAFYAYGVDNPEFFVSEMKKIEDGLNKYNPNNIPEGSCVSMGIEYEVTAYVATPYLEGSLCGYKSDIESISRLAGIGKGRDGIHEIASKPNYNPYMLLAEVKLLQDAGFMDLTFEKYKDGPRGYHLSLVGDSGLEVGSDMNFLSNIMAMSQISGITAGLETTRTKGILDKDFECFSSYPQGGKRCEMKNMSTDSIEQFEKTVLTSHNAGIAMQVNNKYLGKSNINFSDVVDSEVEFEEMLEKRGLPIIPFESDKDRNIVFAWNKFKADAAAAVESHNQNFIDSEFSGGFIDKNGLYIETLNGSDLDTNNRHLIDAGISKEALVKEVYLNPNDLFNQQTLEMINGLTKINNFFLFKRTIPDESSYVLEKQEDGKMIKVLNLSNISSIFKMKDEGKLVRDRDGDKPEKISLFDKDGEIRDGYYNVQGASEEMIIHKSHILLNRFNKSMENLLSEKTVKRVPELFKI